MDKLVEVIKLYDSDGDSYLCQVELTKFQTDVDYFFTLEEINMFDLNNEKVFLENVISAINYKKNDVTVQEYRDIIKKQLDPSNTGKIFIPALINFLKKSGTFENHELIELISKLPHEENYFKY